MPKPTVERKPVTATRKTAAPKVRKPGASPIASVGSRGTVDAHVATKVVKFGGTSMASAAQLRKVADIVLADPHRRIVVVSAPGKRNSQDSKVTDLLIELGRAGLTRHGVDAALAAVVERYAAIVHGLKLPAELLAHIATDLRARVDAKSASDDAYIDNMKAAGEDHSAQVFAAYLKQLGHAAHYVNPKVAGLVLTDEPGNARVLQSSYGKLRTFFRRAPGIVVFPGFFGYSETGRVVTFSRGGSDITGAILAAAADASVYENYTDVDAVCVVDPRLVKNPAEVKEITYREMRELSYAGFSVFHDEALEPVFHAGIPVNVRNTNNPGAPGTMILPTRTAEELPIVGIAATSGFCSLYLSKYLMNREVGFGRRVLNVLEDEGVPFEHMPTGIDNMSVIMRESRFTPATEERIVRRLRMEMAPDEISIERGLALVMVVGEGMRHQVGVAGRACSAIANAGVNLEMINQGSSEVSMMFGIKSLQIARAVKSLYQEFFPTQLSPTRLLPAQLPPAKRAARKGRK